MFVSLNITIASTTYKITTSTQTSGLPSNPIQSSTDSISQGNHFRISTARSFYNTLLLIVGPIVLLILIGIFLWFYLRGRGKAKDRNNLDGIEGVGATYTVH
ncbi:13664_t:CDS:2 [Gigaspora rosea]|nr:13664_t:CDS:2 [Gigaspora rosea]